MSNVVQSQSRVQELLADQAMEGLGSAEELELESLLAGSGQGEDSSFTMTAAVLEITLMQPGEFVALPADVAKRLREEGAAWARGAAARAVRATVTASRDQSRRSSGVVWRYGPWVASAACLAVAAVAWMPAHAADPISLAEHDPNKLEATWAPWTEAAPEQKEATKDAAAPKDGLPFKGCACWSEANQCGYLKLAGLAPNDPCKHQYQLWIVDERGMEQRISGCIFDCKGKGELTVPIRPQFPVHAAQMFAITMEEPGGIAVSKMQDKVAIARFSKH